jgi:hypothetical protein
MGRIENRLAELGESLPAAKSPVANYLGCKITGAMREQQQALPSYRLVPQCNSK